MSVSSISSSIMDAFVQEYATTTEGQGEMLTQDEFLKVFLAELEYQDPLNPMETTETASTLCQYSNLAIQYNNQETLQEISAKLDTQQMSNVLGYIGKEIAIDVGVITCEDGEVYGDGAFTIEESADIEIVIYDSDGSEITRLYPGTLEAGSHLIEWDGKDSGGTSVEDGTYSFEVIATDENGESVAVGDTYTGTVTGIAYEEGYPYLMVGDIYVDPAGVAEVKDPTAPADQTTTAGADNGIDDTG
jgi:flagellar basal-body rod modification protein FlgD